MNRDVAVGIAWAVGLVAVMGGVFAYEYVTYEGGPLEAVETVETKMGTLNEGASKDHTVAVNGEDLGSILVSLTWNDDVGEADRFEVTVRNGAGEEVARQGADSGIIDVKIPITDAPETGSMPDAWEGQQTWTVTVKLLSAPGTPGAVAPLDEADGSQSYSLTITQVHHQPAS